MTQRNVSVTAVLRMHAFYNVSNKKDNFPTQISSTDMQGSFSHCQFSHIAKCFIKKTFLLKGMNGKIPDFQKRFLKLSVFL